MPVGYFISAPWRSSGKTMLSLGLARAARQRSLVVQTFKKGPDYIDPLWLSAASDRPCFNLDPYLQSDAELAATFDSHLAEAAVVLVEGTMGLHDGLHSDGSDSNAAIAKRLRLPTLLIVDCRGMHRTVAALVNGVCAFDPALNIAGVVLNRVRSSRHGEKLERAIREHTDVTLHGMLPETPSIQISEQELGLLPAPEHSSCGNSVDRVACLLSDHCDLDSLFQAPSIVATIASVKTLTAPTPTQSTGITIGIARDAAFHFYYQDDLDTLRERGVTLLSISPLQDDFPTHLDGLIIGGGFPERYANELAANVGFRDGLRQAIADGLAVHAECAGLMYLCRTIKQGESVYPMVGRVYAPEPVSLRRCQHQRSGYATPPCGA